MRTQGVGANRAQLAAPETTVRPVFWDTIRCREAAPLTRTVGRAAHLVMSLLSRWLSRVSVTSNGAVESWNAVSAHMRKCAMNVCAARLVVDDT
jgi:hypothetical protein